MFAHVPGAQIVDYMVYQLKCDSDGTTAMSEEDGFFFVLRDKTCVADPLCTGAVYLLEFSSTNSPVKLSMPQPRGCVATGGFSIEH